MAMDRTAGPRTVVGDVPVLKENGIFVEHRMGI